LGIDSPAERQEFNNLKVTAQKAYEKELGRLNDVMVKQNPQLKWEPANDSPAKTFFALLDQYKTDAKNAEAKEQTAGQNAAPTLAKADKGGDGAAGATAAAIKKQKDALDEANKTKAEKQKELVDTTELVAKLRQELQDSKKNFDDDSVKLQKTIKELQKTIAD